MLRLIWRENKRLILLFLFSFLLALATIIMFNGTGGRSLYWFTAMILSVINFIVFFRKLIKMLMKYEFAMLTKAKKSVQSLLERFYDLCAKIGNALKEKYAGIIAKILPRRWGTILRRYSDKRTFVVSGKRDNGNRLRKMKWRNLISNRERVRYIYITFLRKQIKAGVEISPADTPNELYAKLKEGHEKNSDLDDTLFSLYNIARYNDDRDSSITDEDVQAVRQRKF